MSNAPSFDELSVRFMKALIILLLVFVLGYSYINQSQYYETLSPSILHELPIYSVDIGEEKKVCITFDSAWGTEDLQEILSILNKHRCTAAFFVTGDWAKKNPDAIKSISEAGHIIGNHGDNHKHMTQISDEEMITEIRGCHDIIKTLTGRDMAFFRAPYGDYNDAVVEAAKKCGYYTIQWSVDSLDWKDYGTDSIIKTVCEHKSLTGGAIILLHNGSTYTKEALDALLTGLEQQGYSFISLEDLIIKEHYDIDPTGKQFPKK